MIGTGLPVVRFRRKETLPATRPAGRFVRDKTEIFERVFEVLARTRVQKFHRSTSPAQLPGFLRKMKRLARELDGPAPALRILEVVLWYELHCDDKYIPWVEGGPSLYAKFSRLEAAMRRDLEDRNAPRTVDEVTAAAFNGSRVLAETFRSEVLARARQLPMGEVSDAALAASLAALYSAIREARPASGDGRQGPLGLIRRYVDWLSEKDWRMTVRVLSFDSPAFTQFRREEANRHPLGLDPITGR